jgi:trimethylamine--corrinoid protein Co-methyltransferase
MSGGRYRPLSQGDEQYIHESALSLLAEVGLADPIPSCVEAVSAIGGSLNSNGGLCLPRSLVEDTIASANRRFTLAAQDPRFDIEPWGDRVDFGTGCGAVHNLSPIERSLNPTTISDVYDNARVADSLEHVHFVTRTGTARDLATVEDLDINTCYASICGTSKHVGSVWSSAQTLKKSVEMLRLVAGDEYRSRER